MYFLGIFLIRETLFQMSPWVMESTNGWMEVAMRVRCSMEFVMVLEHTSVAKPLSLTEDSGTMGNDMARY